jgi:hypothetical protein
MRLRAMLVAPMLLGPALALAEAPLSGDAFEAFSLGHTLWFERDGAFHGAEQFLAGRRSLWLYPDGRCERGEWFEADGLICFVYETTPAPQCWRVRQEGDALAAELVVGGVPSGHPVRLVRKDTAPLPCPGPEVGS